MRAFIDIENSKTGKVVTINTKVLQYNSKGECIFDISLISNDERELLINAINPLLTYTDIEMFFIDNDNIPNFGPDFEYSLENNLLYAYYTRDKWLAQRKENRNE